MPPFGGVSRGGPRATAGRGNRGIYPIPRPGASGAPGTMTAGASVRAPSPSPRTATMNPGGGLTIGHGPAQPGAAPVGGLGTPRTPGAGGGQFQLPGGGWGASAPPREPEVYNLPQGADFPVRLSGAGPAGSPGQPGFAGESELSRLMRMYREQQSGVQQAYAPPMQGDPYGPPGGTVGATPPPQQADPYNLPGSGGPNSPDQAERGGGGLTTPNPYNNPGQTERGGGPVGATPPPQETAPYSLPGWQQPGNPEYDPYRRDPRTGLTNGVPDGGMADLDENGIPREGDHRYNPYDSRPRAIPQGGSFAQAAAGAYGGLPQQRVPQYLPGRAPMLQTGGGQPGGNWQGSPYQRGETPGQGMAGPEGFPAPGQDPNQWASQQPQPGSPGFEPRRQQMVEQLRGIMQQMQGNPAAMAQLQGAMAKLESARPQFQQSWQGPQYANMVVGGRF